MSWHSKRLAAKLRTVQFPAEQVEAVKPQFADIVAYHLATFSMWKSLEEQIQHIALDCYLQGAIDGAQIPKELLLQERIVWKS
jgi:hypothetical protein